MTLSPRESPLSASEARPEAAVVSRARELPDLSYRAVLSNYGSPRFHWATPGGFEVAGVGAAARLTASGSSRFDALRADATRLFEDADGDADLPAPARARVFGGLAFHDGHEPAPPWEGFPAAEFVLPRIQLARVEGDTWLTVSRYGPDVDPEAVESDLDAVGEELASYPAMRPSADPPGVASTRLTPSRERWAEQVSAAVQRIEEGPLRKVVLAQALEAELDAPVDVPGALERLRRTHPDCYRFLIEPTDAAGFFGAPPERLVSLKGRTVETEALAGSVGRGDTPDRDRELLDSLLESGKLGHEHGVVAETIRDQLAPLGDVTVGERTVRKLATIQHLRTPITARLDGDEHVLSLVEALHPTPAVGGLPPETAWETIRETESFERGWYAAPVGWFDADGDGEFAVAIRSGVAGDRTATLFAGNGIVADSDPDEEWEEVQLKYRPILDALDG